MEEGYQKEFNDERRAMTAQDVYEGTYQDNETRMRGYIDGRVPDLFISETSPFKAKLRVSKELVRVKLSSAHGDLEYYGPQLTALDEDLLYAILETKRQKDVPLCGREKAEEYGYEFCTFETTYSELLRRMGQGKNQRNINKLKDRLLALHTTSLKLSLPETKDGLWRNTHFHIIDTYRDDDQDRKVQIKFSISFMLLFAMRKHYKSCLEDRAAVSGPAAKRAITYLNFLRHFRMGKPHKINVDKFSDAINWDLTTHKGMRDKALERLKKNLGSVGIELKVSGEYLEFKKTG